MNTRKKEANEVFGDQLRELRLSRGLTQEKLANLSEVPLSQIGKYERGVGNPTLNNIVKLAKFFGVSTAVLIPIQEML
jgi:transcriptional regulator with XRE-family HTH domain